MARALFSPTAPRIAKICRPEVLQEAIASGRQVLRIIWDEADGYPEHAWGYIQWSVRPFRQRQGCDGTIDQNVHLIGLRLCQALGLDYKALYAQAYSDSEVTGEEWAALAEYEAETDIPELSEMALRGLLYDLEDINNSSLLALLEEEFTRLGYNVVEWWLDVPEVSHERAD